MIQIIGIIGAVIFMGAIIDFLLIRKRQAAQISNLGKRIRKSNELFSEYSKKAEKVFASANALFEKYQAENELLNKRLNATNERLKLLYRLNETFMEKAGIITDFLDIDEMPLNEAREEVRSYVSFLNRDINNLREVYAQLSEQEAQYDEREE